uniref:Uncharacterized protein n=1 Tax=Rhizophora mucronata TaxID=61149 RepID=A0A2P2QM62_RHIMU
MLPAFNWELWIWCFVGFDLFCFVKLPG